MSHLAAWAWMIAGGTALASSCLIVVRAAILAAAERRQSQRLDDVHDVLLSAVLKPQSLSQAHWAVIDHNPERTVALLANWSWRFQGRWRHNLET